MSTTTNNNNNIVFIIILLDSGQHNINCHPHHDEVSWILFFSSSFIHSFLPKCFLFCFVWQFHYRYLYSPAINVAVVFFSSSSYTIVNVIAMKIKVNFFHWFVNDFSHTHTRTCIFTFDIFFFDVWDTHTHTPSWINYRIVF